jgi:PAS domain S-box-containing protein
MAKTKILVVENEPLIARDLKMSLERLGYEVSAVASTYQDALISSQENRPDLAFMDINIDGNKDGIQTAKALKTHYDIPIIFLTSLRDLDIIQKAKESDPFGYLVKPFRSDDLQTSIEIALFNHSKTRHLQDDIQKFSSAMHKLDTAVIILDKSGVVDYINSRVEEMSGWKEIEKEKHTINQLLTIDGLPAWSFIENKSEKERLENSLDFGVNSYLLHKNGTKIPVKGQISAFQSPEAKIAGYSIILANEQAGVADLSELGDSFGNQVVDNYFFLKDKSSLYRINLDNVLYIEALGNYVKVTTPQKTYTALIPLKDIESMLPPKKFMRIHRSFIAALDKITAIHATELQVGDKGLPIGKTFREDILKRIKVI